MTSYAAPFHADLIKGIQKGCKNRGWDVDVKLEANQRTRRDLLGDKPPDGVLVVEHLPVNLLQEISAVSPLVLVNNRLPGITCDAINLDNRSGIYDLVRLLS